MSHNQIRGFLGNIFKLERLEEWNLSHNNLREFPLIVGDLELLKVISYL